MSASILFKNKFKKENLNLYYHAKIAHKSSPGIDRVNRAVFETRIDEHLALVNRKVMSGTYKFIPYKEKLISKGRGKTPRVISMPSIRDKVTIGVLNEILSSAFADKISNKLTHSIIDDIKNEIQTKKYDYFVKIDIKGFYDNINHKLLLNNVSKKVKKKEILDLLKKAITNPTIPIGSKSNGILNSQGVPQGISISNILANIFLLQVDKKYLAKKNLKYFRYVDDILILCSKKDSDKIISSLKKDLCDKLQLELNDKKDDGFITKGFDYLGYQYTLINKKKLEHGFSVNEKNVRKLENSLIKILCDYKNNNKSEVFLWKLNLRITGFILEKNKYGWMFFYSQIDDLSPLYHLDWFVNEMCKNFNVPSALQEKIKSFVKTYFEIVKKRGKSDYIPRTDNISIKKQKQILNKVYKFKKETLNELTDEQISKIFKGKIYIEVKDLERDIQSFS